MSEEAEELEPGDLERMIIMYAIGLILIDMIAHPAESTGISQ